MKKKLKQHIFINRIDAWIMKKLKVCQAKLINELKETVTLN